VVAYSTHTAAFLSSVGAAKCILISHFFYKLFNDYVSTADFLNVEWNGKTATTRLWEEAVMAHLTVASWNLQKQIQEN
jgi:hypothetical protein